MKGHSHVDNRHDWFADHLSTLLAALLAIRTEHGGDFRLDQLLLAMAHQLRDQLPGGAAIQKRRQA